MECGVYTEHGYKLKYGGCNLMSITQNLCDLLRDIDFSIKDNLARYLDP